MVNVISTETGATITGDNSLNPKIDVSLKEIPYVMEELAKRIVQEEK